MIIPDDIRDMASYMLFKCVHGKSGGMITRGLKKSIDYALRPDIVFGDLFRETMSCNCSRYLLTKAIIEAPSTSFYSLQIWHSKHDPHIRWNPGNSDPKVGLMIAESISEAAIDKPPGRWRDELMERAGIVEDRFYRMEYDKRARTWWADLSRLSAPGRVSYTVGAGDQTSS